jgi:hypothetical protein
LFHFRKNSCIEFMFVPLFSAVLDSDFNSAYIASTSFGWL